MSRDIGWFGCGAASAVACKILLGDNPEAVIAYCETGAEHPDNERFLADCERWYGKAIVRLRSPEYADTWAVWEKRRYLSGFNGARVLPLRVTILSRREIGNYSEFPSSSFLADFRRFLWC